MTESLKAWQQKAVMHLHCTAFALSNTKQYLVRFSRFAQLTVECPITLQWAATFPPLPLVELSTYLTHGT